MGINCKAPKLTAMLAKPLPCMHRQHLPYATCRLSRRQLTEGFQIGVVQVLDEIGTLPDHPEDMSLGMCRQAVSMHCGQCRVISLPSREGVVGEVQNPQPRA